MTRRRGWRLGRERSRNGGGSGGSGATKLSRSSGKKRDGGGTSVITSSIVFFFLPLSGGQVVNRVLISFHTSQNTPLSYRIYLQ